MAPTGPIVADSAAAQAAINAAMGQRGKPYVWAGSGPGSFDCSGLTAFAFKAAGVSLPHSSRLQSQVGQAVSRDQLQPGDLVFFYSPVSHVGIYIGNGQMVHAPSSGDVVKVAPLMSGFSGARRIAALIHPRPSDGAPVADATGAPWRPRGTRASPPPWPRRPS